jgi:two-component system sensor histidine kinase TctE
MPPLLGVGLVASLAGYFFMTRQLTEAYDRDLGDIARAVVPYIENREGRIGVAFTAQADAVLRADSSERIYYAVLDEKGRHLAGDSGLPAVAAFEGSGPVFWHAAMGERRLRMAALRANAQGVPVIVLAAETTVKRDGAARDALLSIIGPVVLLAFAMLVAIDAGVRRGLLPLDRLRRELQARSHMHLQPVGEATVADELKPLVHELNEMLSRLEAAQQTQTRFIANAAHQLRTPIAALVTQLDLARADVSTEHIEKAQAAAARLARLAQQILSLAAADPVSNPGAPAAPCDLAAIVEERASDWLRAARPRGVEIEFDLATAPIEGNAVLVGELATNLVDNALRYGARVVKVATARRGDRSIVEVTDDGPGIAPAERTRVFDRFHRVDHAVGEGSGLGLSIVREIAQRHRATVELGPASARGGTRIGVVFPAG